MDSSLFTFGKIKKKTFNLFLGYIMLEFKTGEDLKNLRLKLKMTQIQMARSLRWSRSKYIRTEHSDCIQKFTRIALHNIFKDQLEKKKTLIRFF